MEDTYYKRNREKMLARQIEYNRLHREEQRLYYKRWYEKNKEDVEAKRRVKRASKPKKERPPRVKKEKKPRKKPVPTVEEVVEILSEPIVVVEPEPVYPRIFVVSFD